MRILMVCLGNICRSPLAEGILKHRASEHKIDLILDSAGTGSWHVGSLPDQRSIAVARKYGIDITYQRARQFSSKDFERFDIIYAMDESNYEDILSLAKQEQHRNKVRLILDEILPGEKAEVPDPYYGGGDGFERVFKLLDEAAEAILTKLKTK